MTRIALVFALSSTLFFALSSAEALAQPELQREVARIAADAHGKVSVACSLPKAALNCDLNPHARPPMQSVFKFPLALMALHLAEGGDLATEHSDLATEHSDLATERSDLVTERSDPLDRPILFRASGRILPRVYSPLQDRYPNGEVDVPLRELLRLAVALSDNVAADVVLRTLGGPPALDAYIKSLGIAGFHIEDNEAGLHRDAAAQYRNWIEPAAAVQLLRRVNDAPPLTRAHADLLLGWMRDGTRAPNRIKGLLPGIEVMHKPGTSDTGDGLTPATNDIGLIALPNGRDQLRRRLAIAVFVTDSTADEDTRDSVIARIARAAYEAAHR